MAITTYFPRKVPPFSTWYTKNSENRQDSIDQDLDIEANDDVLYDEEEEVDRNEDNHEIL